MLLRERKIVKKEGRRESPTAFRKPKEDAVVTQSGGPQKIYHCIKKKGPKRNVRKQHKKGRRSTPIPFHFAFDPSNEIPRSVVPFVRNLQLTKHSLPRCTSLYPSQASSPGTVGRPSRFFHLPRVHFVRQQPGNITGKLQTKRKEPLCGAFAIRDGPTMLPRLSPAATLPHATPSNFVLHLTTGPLHTMAL